MRKEIDRYKKENGEKQLKMTGHSMHIFGLLTAKERIVTKNAQAAKNHCTLQISLDVSSNPASKTTTDVGIKMLDTNKSANATLTINALPGNIRGCMFFFLVSTF